MRANINKGKLLPPRTLGAALKRRKQLAYEVSRIEAQVAYETSEPPDGWAPERDVSWRTSALRALNLFKLELRLLDEWIDVRQNDSERLLRECYEAMKVLEAQVEFKPHETALMDKLDDWFDNKKCKEATG